MIADNNNLSTIPSTDLIYLSLLKPELETGCIGNKSYENWN